MRNSSAPGLCAQQREILRQCVCAAPSAFNCQGQGIDWKHSCSHESDKRNPCFSHPWPLAFHNNQHGLQRSAARIRVLLAHGAEPEGRLNASHSTLMHSDGSAFESIMFCWLTAIPLTSGTPGCLCPSAVLHGMSSENHMSNRV